MITLQEKERRRISVANVRIIAAMSGAELHPDLIRIGDQYVSGEIATSAEYQLKLEAFAHPEMSEDELREQLAANAFPTA